MRARMVAWLSVMMLVLWSQSAGAQEPPPSAGPGMVEAGKWQVGLTTTWQAAERFKDTREFSSEGGERFSEPSRNLKLSHDRLHLATLSYGLHRRLTLQARAGMAEGGLLSEFLSNGQWEAKLKPVFVWGLGARGLLWEAPNGLGLTAGVSYLRYDDRGIDHWRHDANGWTTNWAGVGVDGKVDYWRLEANALAHWRLGCLMPYLGLGYAYGELKDVDTWNRPGGVVSTYDFSTKTKDNWGLVGGLQAQLRPGLNLGLSFSYFLREELGLSLTWEF